MFCIKESLENAATTERFEYSPLGKELKAQTDMAKKQYQILGSTFESDKIIKKEEPTFKNYNESNLIYNSKHNFLKYYRDRKKINNLSFKSKYLFLRKFLNELNEFEKSKTIKPVTEKKKTKQMDMMQLQNCVMNSEKHILMNTLIYCVQKEKHGSQMYT